MRIIPSLRACWIGMLLVLAITSPAAELTLVAKLIPGPPVEALRTHPVSVTIVQTQASFNGTLSLWMGERGYEIERELQLGKGIFRFDFAPIVNASTYSTHGILTVEVHNQQGQVVAQQSVPYAVSTTGDPRCFAVLRSGQQGIVVGDRRPLRPVRQQDLPTNWQSYLDLDLLVWDEDVPVLLSLEQRKALRHWLLGGGRLLLLHNGPSAMTNLPIAELAPLLSGAPVAPVAFGFGSVAVAPVTAVGEMLILQHVFDLMDWLAHHGQLHG